MKFQREHIRELVPELMPLLWKHYQELTVNKELAELSPKWADYFALEDLGRFVIYTARDDSGTLTAYNAFFLNTHMHYAGLHIAVNDVFYIRDENRRGPLALRFLRYTEAALKALGAQKVAYHFKRSNNLGAILDHLGYPEEEGIAAKII